MTKEEIVDGLEMYTIGRPLRRLALITVQELQDFIDAINCLPSITPERGTGHWIDCNERDPFYRCSKCGERVFGSYHKFCPNCGLKMNSEDDHNDN